MLDINSSNVSEHECFDFDMIDVLRYDMCFTFKRENNQNNK